jgi:hypothetical protein
MERVAAVEILSSVGVVIDGLAAAGYALLHLHPANIIIQVAARLRSHASAPTPPLPRLLCHLFCQLPTLVLWIGISSSTTTKKQKLKLALTGAYAVK